MKIRSQTELQDVLDDSLSTRKRELTTLRFIVLQSKRKHEKQALLRAVIPMLYAHWEGFIKLASTAYLDYVSRQPGVLREYQSNFIALACRSKILNAGASKKIKDHQELVAFILNELDRTFSFNTEGIINTEANLSSRVLQDIMGTIGIPFDDYWQKKEQVIDHQLLKNRNEIAHGQLFPIDEKEFEQLYELVVESLEHFKSLIENSVALVNYKNPPPP